MINIACSSPLFAVDFGIKDNGKKNIKIIPAIETIKYPKEKILKIPCNQCFECRLEYSRQWANRCMLELQYHDSAYFVTLTYDDLHVPFSYVVKDDSTGEAELSAMTLVKRDFQLFMKRLRKKFGDDKIRFFASGEYGTETQRPHYHAILFGLHLDDLKPYKRSQQGYQYYNSESLQSCWCDKNNNPIGYVVVGEVTWETCAYTARYVMKKLKGAESHVYSDLNMCPPFTLMSRKPGIARKYYDEHPDIYEHEFINISTENGGRKIRPPRYYDMLFDLEQPEKMAEIKSKRKEIAEASLMAKLSNTSLDEYDYLRVATEAHQARTKSLRRNIV